MGDYFHMAQDMNFRPRFPCPTKNKGEIKDYKNRAKQSKSARPMPTAPGVNRASP